MQADTRHQRLIRTSGPVADPGGSWGEGTRDAWPVRREGSREASNPTLSTPLKTRAAVGDRGDGVVDTSEDSPSVRVKEEGPPPMQKGGAGNEALFDALLMVARGGFNTSHVAVLYVGVKYHEKGWGRGEGPHSSMVYLLPMSQLIRGATMPKSSHSLSGTWLELTSGSALDHGIFDPPGTRAWRCAIGNTEFEVMPC